MFPFEKGSFTLLMDLFLIKQTDFWWGFFGDVSCCKNTAVQASILHLLFYVQMF